MRLSTNILADFQLTHDDLQRIQRQLFYDGANQRKDLERFAILMFFATAISTYGVIGDSTATVIGAMLIAPLMTPVLAVAAAVVTGDMNRARLSLLIVIGGVVGAVVFAFLIGLMYPSGIISIGTNSQIVPRVSPRLVDLGSALGAGAVGAFASSRKDIADTLPGAAIAIALVPPLAVVGLMLSQGAWAEASGAVLLFLTNFFAILLAGSLIFVMLGLSTASIDHLAGRARQRVLVWIVSGTLIVAVPLGATSYHTVTTTQSLRVATNAVNVWLESSSFELISANLRPEGVAFAIKGEGDPPLLEQLVSIVRSQTQKDLRISLEIVPVNRHQVDLADLK